MPSNDNFDLSPDPIVSGDDKFDEPVLRLRGYVGEKYSGKVRLYWDLSKTSYYEISESDILDRVHLGDDDGSLLVIKLSAKLEVVRVGTLEAIWLQGDITSTYLGEPIVYCHATSTTRLTLWWPPTTTKL